MSHLMRFFLTFNALLFRTLFKSSLLRYLRYYEVSAVHQFISAVESADMSGINVAFVSSGNTRLLLANSLNFRLPLIVNSLYTLLQLISARESQGRLNVSLGSQGCGQAAAFQRAFTRVLMARGGPGNAYSPLSGHHPVHSHLFIGQCSSIGSLGQSPDTWLEAELGTSFASVRPGPGGPLARVTCRPHVSLIYPSHEDVLGSYDGLLGGGCLPYSRATAVKQPWLQV